MASCDTRERLILAAERLFAHNGIQGVSLREINLAAGQRNTSASHYHFGSKDALLVAVLEHRDGLLRERRLRLLDEVIEHGPVDLAKAVTEAMVHPTAALMDLAPDYLLFVAQLFLQPPRNWRDLVTRHDSALTRAADMLSCRIPVPDRLIMHRLVAMMLHFTTALATHIRVSQDGGDDIVALPRPVFVSSLVDSMTAYLVAEPSSRTLGLLAEGGSLR